MIEKRRWQMRLTPSSCSLAASAPSKDFLEAATWTQLGIQSKPCGILNIGGYFDPLLNLLRTVQ